MAYDISLDQAKAITWINDVEVEFIRVDAILKRVNAVCEDVPASDMDDPIIKGIKMTGDLCGTVWTNLTNAFKKSTDNLKSAMDLIGNAVQGIGTQIENFKSTIH